MDASTARAHALVLLYFCHLVIIIYYFSITDYQNRFVNMLILCQHEKREAEKAQEHAYNCEGNEKIVAMSAIEAKGFTFHEHHEKKEAKKKDEEEHEKNHRHLFYHQKESKENIDYKVEEKHHKLLEHLSKLSAGVTGDYALVFLNS